MLSLNWNALRDNFEDNFFLFPVFHLKTFRLRALFLRVGKFSNRSLINGRRTRGEENSLDEFDRDKKMEVGRKNSRIDRNGKNVLNGGMKRVVAVREKNSSTTLGLRYVVHRLLFLFFFFYKSFF